MLDIPCGDMNWMKELELSLDRYIGADIVPAIINENRERFEDDTRKFIVRDITRDPLPDVDVILCRDCLAHLPFRAIFRALRNIQRSGSRFLLTTTYPQTRENTDVLTGLWRPLNLCAPPISLPEPLQTIVEERDDLGEAAKSLGLWRVSDTPDFPR